MEKHDLKLLMDAVRHVGHGFHRQFNSVAAGTGLKGHHVRYLAALRRSSLTAKELSDHLRVDKGHTSRVLAELTALGLVERVSESRGAPLTLTAEGYALSEALDANIGLLAGRVADSISDEDFAAFMRVATTVEEILKEEM